MPSDLPESSFTNIMLGNVTGIKTQAQSPNTLLSLAVNEGLKQKHRIIYNCLQENSALGHKLHKPCLGSMGSGTGWWKKNRLKWRYSCSGIRKLNTGVRSALSKLIFWFKATASTSQQGVYRHRSFGKVTWGLKGCSGNESMYCSCWRPEAPRPMSDGSQLQLTSAPGGLTSSSSFQGHCTPAHTHNQAWEYTRFFKKKLQGKRRHMPWNS